MQNIRIGQHYGYFTVIGKGNIIAFKTAGLRNKGDFCNEN